MSKINASLTCQNWKRDDDGDYYYNMCPLLHLCPTFASHTYRFCPAEMFVWSEKGRETWAVLLTTAALYL